MQKKEQQDDVGGGGLNAEQRMQELLNSTGYNIGRTSSMYGSQANNPHNSSMNNPVHKENRIISIKGGGGRLRQTVTNR